MTGDQDSSGRPPRTPPGPDQPRPNRAGSAPDEQAGKRALRRQIRARRRARSEPDREQVARGLTAVVQEMPEVRAARCVALYASMPGEPGTGPLRQALRRRGLRVLLPVVLRRTSTWTGPRTTAQTGRAGAAARTRAARGWDPRPWPRRTSSSSRPWPSTPTGGGSARAAGATTARCAGSRRARWWSRCCTTTRCWTPTRTRCRRLPHDLPVARAATPTRWVIIRPRRGSVSRRHLVPPGADGGQPPAGARVSVSRVAARTAGSVNGHG